MAYLTKNAKTLAHYFKETGYDTLYWKVASCKRKTSRKTERGGYDYWLGANALRTSSNHIILLYTTITAIQLNPGYRVDI